MSMLIVGTANSLQGSCVIPGDKSISHRALMFAALAKGTSRVCNFLNGSDCLATAHVMKSLGVEIIKNGPTDLAITGKGLYGLQSPQTILNCENSGTTIRLMTGILSAQNFHSTLDGSEQIRRRPMGRVIKPLQKMGAHLRARENDTLAPIRIAKSNNRLNGIEHHLNVASAQVKSAILLAGLYANDKTRIWEPGPSRDHTERLLSAMGANILREGDQVTVFPQEKNLSPFEMRVPSDPSSAAFVIAAGLIVPGSLIHLKGVSTNPTRTGFLDAARKMGGLISCTNNHVFLNEEVADISLNHSGLLGHTFGGDIIVRMIDEIPILAVLATQAKGVTTIRDAKELKVKETNRIDTTVSELRKMGAKIEPLDDGLIIEGGATLKGAVVNSHGDHRLAMALAIAALCARGETIIENAEVTVDSFPGFVEALRSLGAPIREEGA